ncbi:MAG: hypothetical protein OEW37_10110, partial [Rhodospirillaceae bacterium]|nr:hypothetical protein [Rhodospirillaceae bacterium]
MREFNPAYETALANLVKSHRFVVRLDFDGTSPLFIKSHATSATPPGAAVLSARIISGGVSSQNLESQTIAEIGTGSFQAIDVGGTLTDALRAKLQAGYSINLNKAVYYKGFEGAAWDEYEIFETQLAGGLLSYHQGVYTVNTKDVQRYAKENIFTPVTTNLTATISADDTTLPVVTTALLEGLEHGYSYTDAPAYTVGTLSVTNGSATVNGTGTSWVTGGRKGFDGDRITIAGVDYTVASVVDDVQLILTSAYAGSTNAAADYTLWPRVLYVQLENELIRCPVGGLTDTSLTNVQRGALNTKAVKHEVSATASAARKLEVSLHPYIEMPVPKLIYALLLGVVWGQPGAVFPRVWSVSMHTDWLRNEDFETIGADLWDTATDDGEIAYINGATEQTCKTYIETELLPRIGCFMNVYASGEWGLRRRARKLLGAQTVADLNDSNVVSAGALQQAFAAMKNKYTLDWDYSGVSKKYRRTTSVVFAESIRIFKQQNAITVKAGTLHGDRHSAENVKNMIQRHADAFASPPLTIAVGVHSKLEALEVGDVVRLNVSTVRDYTRPGEHIDRAMEVIRRQATLATGKLDFTLRGSTSNVSFTATSANDSDISDAWYTSQGSDLATAAGANYSNTGGVGHIFGNLTLAPGVYYHAGDLQVDAAAIINLSAPGTLEFRVRSHFQHNGTVNLLGAGQPGGAGHNNDFTWQPVAGGVGALGRTVSAGGLAVLTRDSDGAIFSVTSHNGAVVNGTHAQHPVWNVVNNNGTPEGLPSDLQGTGGAGGVAAYVNNQTGSAPAWAAGGAGGAGGGGFIVVCRGMSCGANATINVSGAAGQSGGSITGPAAGYFIA